MSSSVKTYYWNCLIKSRFLRFKVLCFKVVESVNLYFFFAESGILFQYQLKIPVQKSTGILFLYQN